MTRPPVHNSMPGSAGVITTEFWNRKRNSGLHDNNAKDNEEDGRSAENEEEESITSSENKINNQNNPENDPVNAIKQEDELLEYESHNELEN